MRHLVEAWKVRPRLFGGARVPLQPLLLAAAVAAGVFLHPLAGLGIFAGQVLFTLGLANSGAFRRWVRTQDVQRKLSRREDQRQKLIERLTPERRDRLFELSKIFLRIQELHEAAPDLPLQAGTQLHSLERMQWLFLKLLVGQQMLAENDRADDARRLRKECRHLAEDLELRSVPEDVRRSKLATLDLLRRRLDAIERRDHTLQRIESDLIRIQASMELALEQAALEAHPTELGDQVEFTTGLLDDRLFDDLGDTVHELDESFGTVPAANPTPQARAQAG